MEQPFITQAVLTHYQDTQQVICYVNWSDGSQTSGRPDSTHMQQLVDRARRERKPVLIQYH